MHIPDGFIADPLIWGGCSVLSLLILGVASRQVGTRWQARAPLLPAMTGAFLFAAQMFNFPVAGGTSGHLLGGLLACVLLGGWTGMLVTALVLTVQCLLFQDGGVTALGANVFNMAVVGGGGAYVLYTRLASLSAVPAHRKAMLIGSGFVGVQAAALLAGLQIGVSGVVPLQTALAAMSLVHVPIGLAEGVATAAIVGALQQLRPDLLLGAEPQPVPSRVWALAGVGIVSLAGLAVLFASSSPDGLEHVAEQLGFSSRAFAALPAPFPDYQLHDESSWFQKLLISMVGLMVVSGTLIFVQRLVTTLRRSS